MPFTKVFGTTSGSYATAANWRAVSVRSANYIWTASASGTNEYYLTTAASGDPGFVAQPTALHIGGVAATEGTAGSLTAGQWDYADNDTLGFSTIYVRLADGADPDSKDVDHVQFYQIPQTGEHVRLAADSGSITAGFSQSGVAIGDFIVEEGYQGAIGSASLGYLYIDPNRFEFNGQGTAYIDLTTAAIPAEIYGTVGAATGERGLYLRGTALTVVNVMGGVVGLASQAGETSTITTVRVLGPEANVWVGNGVSLTNLHQYGGEVRVRCNVSALILYNGRLVTEENSAITTATQYGGEYIYQSSGNVTTFNLQGGALDLQASGAARTIGTLNKFRGSYRILRNKEAVTITTETPQETFTEIGTF